MSKHVEDGRGNAVDLAGQRDEVGGSRPTTCMPPVYHWFSPSSSVPVPSVAMKELILARVTSSPLISPTDAPSRMHSSAANSQGRPCCVTRPLASTWAMPRIEATDRSKLLEASGIITASATMRIDRAAVHHRLEGEGGEERVALEDGEHDDQRDQQDRQIPDRDEPRGAGAHAVVACAIVCSCVASP